MPKILLADDSTHAQRMGAKILSSEGIEVIAVSNGDAAVKKLQELDFDLVLADVYMPGLDGYELCQWVKKSEGHPGLPVVLVVGALELYEPDRIEQVHADGLLKKPFEASGMMETLRPLMEASLKAKPGRKKNEIEPEKTASMAPPETGTEETVEIPPAEPAFDSTVRIAPPQGSKDVREGGSAVLAGEAAAAVAAAPTPEPAMMEFESPAAPEPEPEPPATEYEPASELTIPDIATHEEPAMGANLYGAVSEPEPAPAPAASKWVAEPAEVTPIDNAKFGGTTAQADAPPDWGELLKSVEDGSSAPATPAALELEIPAETPAAPAAAAPAPPPIDEEELRTAIHLCLENALPGLVDEITSAVLRRLGRG